MAITNLANTSWTFKSSGIDCSLTASKSKYLINFTDGYSSSWVGMDWGYSFSGNYLYYLETENAYYTVYDEDRWNSDNRRNITISDGTDTTNAELIAFMTTNASITSMQVKFQAGSYGSGTSYTATKTGGTALTLQGALFTRSGYTQEGWSVNANGTTCDYALNGTYSTDEPITLYPYWVSNICTVTFDVMGHGSAPSTQTVTRGGLVSEPTAPTETGYIFSGWYADETYTTSWNFTTDTVSSDMTLYAKWSVTVSFDLQGHGSAIASQQIVVGGKPTEPTSPTATGYVFGGWYKEAECTSAWSFSGLIADIVTENTTLYAKWTVITYTVEFNANGHGTAPSSQTIDYGHTASVPTAPTASGYTFGGWYTESSCTNEFDFDTSITEDKTLYAKWTIITYNIVYHLSGGTATNPFTYTIESASFTLNNPTKTNSTFTGWTGTGLSESSLSVTIYSGSIGDREYTASFLNNENVVSFDLQGHGGSTPTSQIITRGGLVTEPSPAPTQTGYTFNGWFTEEECENEWDFSTDIPTEDMTLYAGWTVITYAITYNLDGGSVTIANPTTYNVDTESFTLNNPTKSHYTFQGWTGTGLSEATMAVTISQGSTGARSYVATYAESASYTFSFNMNGHGTQIASQTVYAGETATEPTAPTADGYTFVGWYTDSTLSTPYNFSSVVGANTTVYASWSTQILRVSDPMKSQSSTIDSYHEDFEDGDIAAAQALVSSTTLPLKSSTFNNVSTIVGVSSSSAGVQGIHKTNVADVLNADKAMWFNETSGSEGWVYNLIATDRTTYNASTTYRKNDVVLYTDANNVTRTCIAKQDVPTGTNPTNTTYWLSLNLEGAQGNPWWGVNYKGDWDSTSAYNQFDMVRYMNGRIAEFYVAMEAKSAGASLDTWLLALEMYESTIISADAVQDSGTYYIDDGSNNIVMYNGRTALDVYTVLSNVVFTSSTSSYVSSGMLMHNALIAMTQRNNLY